MKNEFKISRMTNCNGKVIYAVKMYYVFHWILIKIFTDDDETFAKREAEELLEKLEEK